MKDVRIPCPKRMYAFKVHTARRPSGHQYATVYMDDAYACQRVKDLLDRAMENEFKLARIIAILDEGEPDAAEK